MTRWERITDVNRVITYQDHGRILRVGKRNFRRISVAGMPEFWKMGFDAMRKSSEGFIFRKKDKWFIEK